MPNVIIDADFFPHIVDSIFAHASSAALLALRVNTQWRRRAEHQLAHHICVVVNTESMELPQSITYHLVSTENEPIGRYTSTCLDDVDGTVLPSFLSSTEVIDLNLLKFTSGVARLLQHVPSSATYRCTSTCDLSHLNVPARSRVVILSKDMEGYDEMSYFANYRLNRMLGPKKLVLHLRKRGMESPSLDWMCLGDMLSLTLVIHPWIMHSSRPRINYPRKVLLCRQMGLIIDLILTGYLHGIPTTVVNFDFSDFEAQHPDVGSVKDRVLEHIDNRKLGYVNMLHPVSVRFLTLEEYRAEVGDVQFQIDTNDGAIASPGLKIGV